MSHPRVIGYLQRAIDHEFGAAQQLTLQAGVAETLGIRQLASQLRSDAQDELRHAEMLIVRLVGLGLAPRAGQCRVGQIGRTQGEMLRNGRDREAAAVSLYREASVFCRRINDSRNAELFEDILQDEQRHFTALEQQLAAGA